MTAITGFVDNSGGILAHHKMLALIKSTAEAEGWTTLRYDDVSASRELILYSTGLDGIQQIYIGFRTYDDVGADYYNLSVAGFTGYVPGNAFTAQPGYVESGIPAHNQRIDYWMVCNLQRVAFGLKVGTPVYEHGYVGKMLPYAKPTQYPYPLVVGGMLSGTPATRFSDTAHSLPYKGDRNNMKLRFVDGSWINCGCWPYDYARLAGNGGWDARDTNGLYTLQPVILHNNSNSILGVLDGVFHISGFNNVVENTLVIDSKNYVVLQDVYRTGFTDYIALELE